MIYVPWTLQAMYMKMLARISLISANSRGSALCRRTTRPNICHPLKHMLIVRRSMWGVKEPQWSVFILAAFLSFFVSFYYSSLHFTSPFLSPSSLSRSEITEKNAFKQAPLETHTLSIRIARPHRSVRWVVAREWTGTVFDWVGREDRTSKVIVRSYL